ncbi:MAG: tRNA lysidine(34) synthetase TilS [Eubacteriales bacterium]
MKSRNKRYYLEKTLCWIRERELIRGGEAVLCALSGGADSVAMTLLLKELSETLGIRVCAAHVNHMLRGGEAQRDEDFCRGLCGERGIPFTALRGDAAALAAELGTGTEDAARELRYGLLFSLGADLVAVAHNADDNLETVIMRLVRGGGARGLAGIPPGNRNVIRPIMCLTRAETEEVCREFGADFVTDSTNLSDDCTRNIVRHRVTGELRGLNPSISELVLANSIRLREEDAFLDGIAAEKLAENGGTLSAELFESCGPVLSRRMLRIAAGRAGAEIDGEMTEKLLSLSLGGKSRFSFDVGKGVYFGEYGVFRFGKTEAPEDFDFELSEGKSVEIGKWRVRVQKEAFGEQKIYRIFKTFAINSDRIHGGLRVRNARSGDVFRKNAKSGSKKLGKLYSDMKFPMEVRKTLPVLADGEGVIFVPGIGPNAARDFGGTGRVLEIVFEKRIEQEPI